MTPPTKERCRLTRRTFLRRSTAGVCAGGICAGLGVGLAAGCRRHVGADDEVVLYCSVDQTVAEPIVAAFEQAGGFRVRARYDTEANKTVGLVQKIRAEAERPIADVFWSSEVFYTIRLAEEGLLEPYSSPVAQAWPAAFRDTQNRWFGLALRARVIAYAGDRVPAEQAPRRLEDLLNSRWKQRIVMADPDRGTTGGDVASWFVTYGPQEARRILQGLRDNGMRLVEGNATAVRQVVNGQADVCLTDTDDVYAMRRNGTDLGMEPLRRADQGTLAIPNTCAIVRGAPHQGPAEALMAFLLDGPVEQMLLESDSHNWPVGFEPGPEYSDYAIVDPIRIDYAEVAAMLGPAKQAAREIFA